MLLRASGGALRAAGTKRCCARVVRLHHPCSSLTFMIDRNLRTRVQRLLYGEFNPEDIGRLYVSLRLSSFGAQTVREIGHFAAHPDERDKGLTTDMAKDFFTVLRFQAPMYETKKVDLGNLPANFHEAMRRNFAMMDKKFLSEHTKLKYKVAKHVLDGLLPKFVKTNGSISLTASLTDQESTLVKFLITSITVKPAFDDERLFKEFAFTLTKNGLLDTAERRVLANRKPAIALYAIAIMHGCNIILDQNDLAELSISVEGRNYELSITAAAAWSSMPRVRIAGPMFQTSLSAQNWTEEPLLGALQTNVASVRDFAIELTTAQRLVKIGN
jgi:hypothetical protein